MQTRRKLRPYQMDAFRYCMRVRNPALFMDMRLGKTVVAIRRALLAPPRDRALGLKCLVAAPNSALPGWRHELELEGVTSVAQLTGPRPVRLKLLRQWEHNWYLFNKEGHLALPEVNKYPWDWVILDESWFIANPQARVTKFFLSMPPSRRMVLTGTPNPESDLQFFCQFKFLNGTVFGSDNYWAFRAKYFKPSFTGYTWEPTPEGKERIQHLVETRSFSLTRKQAGVRVESVNEQRSLTPPASLMKAYRQAEKNFLLEWEGQEVNSTLWATTKHIWLRRLASGWVGEKQLVWDGKVKEATELLTGELARQQAVLWCFFNSEVAECSRALAKAKVTHRAVIGKTPLHLREDAWNSFRAGRSRVLVLQQAIAQTGVDLSAADTSLYFSLPEGYLAYSQIRDRILSVSKKTGLLHLYLTTEGTVDEDVYLGLVAKGLRSRIAFSRFLFDRLRARNQR